MLFNSFEFFVFMAVFLPLYFSLPSRVVPFLILTASYVFYAGWRPSILVLLVFTTVVDYAGARIIDGTASIAVRRLALIASLTINLGLLATFKYLDFAIRSVAGAAGYFGIDLPDPVLNLVLPIGISFYTFQSVGYTLDVYYRRIPAEKNIITYAEYVAFFPQLVAGPIERAAHMLPQFRSPRRTNPERVVTGLWLIGYGLFKKMCIADLIAPVVNGIYADPVKFSASYTLIATILFAIQIYCDFSGYSDIAVGTARILGFDLLINFKQPYFSSSLTDFWRRWHIALSSWFRDFVYVPLGGNNVDLTTWVRNILIVFCLSGLWHGANWTFVLWGLIHGAGVATEGVIARLRMARAMPQAVGAAPSPRTKTAEGIFKLVGFLMTISTVMVAWVFFRASSIADAAHILSSWAALSFQPVEYGTFKVLGLASFEIMLAAIHILVLLTVDALIQYRPDVLAAGRASAWSTVAAGALLYDIALFGVFGRTDFIYFQF
jgi:D-alanyl-lipoteichoic acid acyltransferase DltB (MBOAT superfamily)